MKAILAAAALAAALVPVPGHAATLAQCGGTAPTSGPPPLGTQLAGRCTASLTATGVTTVTMTLEPGLDFVGTLQAALRKVEEPIGMGFKGIFAGPVLVLGDASQTFDIDAGTWNLEVLAGYLPPCQPTPTPPPLMHCSRVLPAIGSFGGSVSTA